jgi:hypothetical protein
MILFALENFEIQNDANRKFIDTLVVLMRDKIYESEPFDEHLDFNEYIVLRDITRRLNQLRGGQD